MKEILLKIDDEIFGKWKQEIGIKMMCGNFDAQSITDAVPALIVQAIEESKKEVMIFPKERQKK